MNTDDTRFTTTSNDRLGTIANIASLSLQDERTVYRFFLQDCARQLVPNERVADCLRCHAPLKETVEVRKSQNHQTAYYANLVVCSRVWLCPVCASRITEERRKELHKAITAWRGGKVMVTYTLRHNRGMRLEATLEKFLDAYRSFKGGKMFQSIKRLSGWQGSVKALEVTYGENGWHPHIHELVLLSNKIEQGYEGHMQVMMRRHWLNVLERHGLDADYTHGLDVREADKDIADYIAKYGYEPRSFGWTAAHELTKSPAKVGNLSGKSPLQLLMDYGEGDMKAGKLWREYAACFKGKHQLQWSLGVRELLGLDKEKTDEEIAESIPEDTILFAQFTKREWQAIKASLQRGRVLQKAGEMTLDQFEQYITQNMPQWLKRLQSHEGAE